MSIFRRKKRQATSARAAGPAADDTASLGPIVEENPGESPRLDSIAETPRAPQPISAVEEALIAAPEPIDVPAPTGGADNVAEPGSQPPPEKARVVFFASAMEEPAAQDPRAYAALLGPTADAAPPTPEPVRRVISSPAPQTPKPTPRASRKRLRAQSPKKKARPMTPKIAKPKLSKRMPPAKKPTNARIKKPVAAMKVRLVERRNAPTPKSMMPAAEAKASPNLAFPTNVNDSRQAFVVLAWFEYLLRRIPARELPYLIDSYRRIGWIDDDLHAWFIKMAQGVGGTRTKAGESQFARQGARGLVTIHKETLRFLNQLRTAPPRTQNQENGAAAHTVLNAKR